MNIELQQFQIESGLGRIRLDDYLFARFGSLSRMYLCELVRTEQVVVNGCLPNIGTKLRANDFVEIAVDMSRGSSMRPENIPLAIVFEDDWIIVIDKPAGMLVHPTHRDKNGTLLNALVYYLNEDKLTNGSTDVKVLKPLVRPGLVHRLDRETSGLIVVAKSVDIHRRLGREFLKKRVEKRYVALLDGVLKDDEGTIESPIGRFAEKKLWDVKDDGKHSITNFRVIDRFKDSTLVELEPVTGRTNQLRIHCASKGHPIVGDIQRGGRAHERLCLHAFRLTVRHPVRQERITFDSQVPTSFQKLNY